MPPKRSAHDEFVDSLDNSDEGSNDEYDFDDMVASTGKGKKGSGKDGSQGHKQPGKSKSKGKGKSTEQSYAWEEAYTRSWDAVQEDEGGNIAVSVQDMIARARRKRLAQPALAVRRTIIRHSILLLDLSAGMMDRDLRPNRFDLMLSYSREFISEWFDQNPLGQVGVVGMRAGLGERLGEMSGNPQEVIKSISDRTKLEPAGDASLQNAIEMARSGMSHLPTHSSREIVIIFGALTTCDPDNIHDTIDSCVKDKIRVSVVALAAEMKVCRDLCDRTGGVFGVAMNEGHFKDLLFELVPPPAQKGSGPKSIAASSDLMMMGFPTRLPESSPASFCVCHSTIKSEGFLCPRCSSKLCDIPTDCDVCGLMIVSSPHLARSYHHLFPIPPYRAVNIGEDTISGFCHGCAAEFEPVTAQSESVPDVGVSPLGRYRCGQCRNDFCGECDAFVHDTLHVCPGCR